ncbi:hypothetical protein BDF14DRAFT_1865989 [Spinellus fusiger]|nr:hypothetical protein BDF14DRAFT_1865989 [Spinellus fusiger]
MPITEAVAHFFNSIFYSTFMDLLFIIEVIQETNNRELLAWVKCVINGFCIVIIIGMTTGMTTGMTSDITTDITQCLTIY